MLDEIRQMALAYGFNDCYVVPAFLAKDMPDTMQTLIILMKAYEAQLLPPADMAAIHPYYIASQQAYMAAKAMAVKLNQKGLNAWHDPNIQLKAVCHKLTPFWQGKNTLVYHGDIGSRFHIQAIALEQPFEWDMDLIRPSVPESRCGHCDRCLRACPTGCISDRGVDPCRCLRDPMLSGRVVPADLAGLMKNRLVGCDECQMVCPYNQPVTHKSTWHVPVKDLLPPQKETQHMLAGMIGANLAIGNRLCAQACVIAGNSQERAYLAMLKPLIGHPSTIVAKEAALAVKKLESV